MKRTTLILLMLVLGCAPRPEPITDSEVIETVEGFFEALDVENTDPALMDQYITKDFMIYEAGQKMSREEFLGFVHDAPILESDWELSDFRISTGHNSAHASLLNNGTFVVQPDSVRMRVKYKWLESAYLVKEEGRLKIRFYFSDNIGVQSDTLP